MPNRSLINKPMHLSTFTQTMKSYPAIVMGMLLIAASVLFLTLNASGSWEFILSLRGKKLLALMTVGFAIGTSTLLFQTLTHNPILTPALLGFDSLYILIKSLMVFVLGSVGMAAIPAIGKFALEVVIMLLLSLAMFRLLFGRQTQDLTRLILVGVVFGLLFRSLSYLVARMIDPEEFVTIQAVSYAGFNTINTQVLGMAVVLCVLCAVVMYRLRHQLDILLLGKLPAINLGIDYQRLGFGLLAMIALLVAVSTAMVGPVTFFGLLVCALTNRIAPSMHHGIRLVLVALVAMLCLVAGQLMFEQVFKMAGVLEVVIELVGGLVFLWIIFHQYAKAR
ncbi:iron chelate uptake ABC transporter family permease subunit [Moraxella canis]|uniref:Iron chelate uptake ABC transporter family permease subunit n=1 Tax=Moraxella canis TaxID=90239 RepID=A0ABZ0WVG8_9GAMM|nr:iron chelate uptake ABC transporter family permease subunit [Moraxella canis]WQE03237.1 iron chelate uptake ABC transporter family permease subunit [Moraxella canis]